MTGYLLSFLKFGIGIVLFLLGGVSVGFGYYGVVIEGDLWQGKYLLIGISLMIIGLLSISLV